MKTINDYPEHKRCIEEYACREFGFDSRNSINYDDLSDIGLAYTTTEDERHEIYARADLVNFRIETLVDGNMIRSYQFANADEMLSSGDGLRYLDFGSLVELDQLTEEMLRNEPTEEIDIDLEEADLEEVNDFLWKCQMSNDKGLQFIAHIWNGTDSDICKVKSCRNDLDAITYAIISACGTTVHEAYVNDNEFCTSLAGMDWPTEMALPNGYIARYYAGYLSIWSMDDKMSEIIDDLERTEQELLSCSNYYRWKPELKEAHIKLQEAISTFKAAIGK